MAPDGIIFVFDPQTSPSVPTAPAINTHTRNAHHKIEIFASTVHETISPTTTTPSHCLAHYAKTSLISRRKRSEPGRQLEPKPKHPSLSQASQLLSNMAYPPAHPIPLPSCPSNTQDPPTSIHNYLILRSHPTSPTQLQYSPSLR